MRLHTPYKSLYNSGRQTSIKKKNSEKQNNARKKKSKDNIIWDVAFYLWRYFHNWLSCFERIILTSPNEWMLQLSPNTPNVGRSLCFRLQELTMLYIALKQSPCFLSKKQSLSSFCVVKLISLGFLENKLLLAK